MLDRLVDVPLVQLLRVWLASGQATGPSWFSALNDTVVSPAVGKLHVDPS